MRWRLIDRSDRFIPWKTIAGVKTVTFEEKFMIKPVGRMGDGPESLLLESCVELLRWLVVASSEFTQTCVITEVEDFRLAPPLEGDSFRLRADVEHRDGDTLSALCRLQSAGETVASGRLVVTLSPLADNADPAQEKALWREIHGTT